MFQAKYFLADQQVFEPKALIEFPEVSVVMPTFRRGDNGMLKRSIESVLNQTQSSLELIIVDDGSFDSTQDICQGFVRSDDRVRYVRHNLNSGLPALRVNEGLLLARAPLFAYQFDDDRWQPETVATLKSELNKRNRPSLAYGKCIYREESQEYTFGRQVTVQDLSVSNAFANNAVLHHRQLSDAYGTYDMHIAMRRLCDWDLWLRWVTKAEFIFVDEIVSYVDAAMDYSLQKMTPYDASVFRAFNSIDRTPTLQLSECFNQIIDAPIEQVKAGSRLSRVVSRHVAEYAANHRNAPVNIEYIPKPAKSIIITSGSRETNQDIMFFNYRDLVGGIIEYIPADLIDPVVENHANAVMFVRTLSKESGEAMARFNRSNVATAYVLDDDLLSFFDLDPNFGYLEPGHPVWCEMIDQLSAADACYAYSDIIAESCRTYNPRVIQLSTNILERHLPRKMEVCKRAKVRFGFAGGGARAQEFRLLWPAIVEFAADNADKIEFVFFGYAPEGMDELACPVQHKQFLQNYSEYISELRSFEIDFMIAPLLDDKRAKAGKCPIKFLEFTSANSIGIYSDAIPYATIEDGVDGLKALNTVQDWKRALERALSLSVQQRLELLHAASEKVRQFHTTEALQHQFKASMSALEFHQKTRSLRGDDGRPTIALFIHSPWLGGAESAMIRHATLLQRYGIRPIVVLPSAFEGTSHELQVEAARLGIEYTYLPVIPQVEPVAGVIDQHCINIVAEWLRHSRIAVVQAVTLMLTVSLAAREAGVPFVGYAFQVESDEASAEFKGYADFILSDSLRYAARWEALLEVPAACLRGRVPNELFDQGFHRALSTPGLSNREGIRVGIFGTVQPRKGQLQTIKALGILKAKGVAAKLSIAGYRNFFPGYLEECQNVIDRDGLGEDVVFHGFVDPTSMHKLFDEIDVLICASDAESLPQVVIEAMASRVFVISNNVGGLSEFIGEHTGILVQNNDDCTIASALERYAGMAEEEIKRRLDNAYQVVFKECNSDTLADNLLTCYNNVLCGSLQNNSKRLLVEAVNLRHQIKQYEVEDNALQTTLGAVHKAESEPVDSHHTGLAHELRMVNSDRNSLEKRNYALEAQIELLQAELAAIHGGRRNSLLPKVSMIAKLFGKIR